MLRDLLGVCMVTIGRFSVIAFSVAMLSGAFALVLPAVAIAEPHGFSKGFENWRKALSAPNRRDSNGDIQIEGDVPGVIIAEGVNFVAEGLVAAGYDSNIDYRVEERDGGVYAKTDLGMALIAKSENAETTAVVRGGYGRHGIDLRPDRYDIGVLLDHYRIVAPNTSLNFGGFFLHDDIDVDANQRAAGYSQFSYNAATMEAFVRSRALHSHYLVEAGAGPIANRFFARDETFDHLRLEQSAGALFLKDQRLAPFFETGYANLDYTREIDPAVFTRDGDEIWAVGGVRVTLDKTLYVDLGARYNQRWLDGGALSSHDSVFFDGKIVYVPSDDLYVEFNIDRSFLEPVVEEAFLTESTTYALLVNTRLDERTRLKFEVGRITEEQIGAPDFFRHIYGEAQLSHDIGNRTELFTSVLGYHTTNDASEDEVDRFEFMAGVRIRN